MKARQKVVKFFKSLFILAVTFLLGYGIISGYLGWLNNSDTLNIRKMEYRGNDLLSVQELKSLIGGQQFHHMTNVSLTAIDSSLRSNPFIETVKVTRAFPGDIVMKIIEKQPVALLRVDEELYCIDRHGLVLQSRPGRMYNLPILSGDFRGGVRIGSQAESPLLSRGLTFLNLIISDQPDLYSEISEIVTGCEDNLTVYTNKGGIPVKFGKNRDLYKLQCLDAILTRMEIENNFFNVKYIDLRYRNQVILGMRT